MNIMLICAGGVSTGLLMKKIEDWSTKMNLNIKVKAYGVMNYDDYVKEYDCILVGPQIEYKLEDIKNNTSIPVALIDPLDYAMGKVENIITQVNGLLG